jgi:hypothetical protein
VLERLQYSQINKTLALLSGEANYEYIISFGGWNAFLLFSSIFNNSI